MNDDFERGKTAVETWGGDTSGPRRTAQRILSHLRHEVKTPEEVRGAAEGMRAVAAEMERIAVEAEEAARG